MRKIKYDGEIHEVKDIIMINSEDFPGEYEYEVHFDTGVEKLPINEVEIL